MGTKYSVPENFLKLFLTNKKTMHNKQILGNVKE